MFELLLVAGVVYLIWNVITAKRSGDVPVIQRMADGAEELQRTAKRMHWETEAQVEHGRWFKTFRMGVEIALDHALHTAEMQRWLGAGDDIQGENLVFRKADSARDGEAGSLKELAELPPPAPTRRENDPPDLDRAAIHAQFLTSHRTYVSEVRSRLHQDPLLAAIFRETLTKIGMGAHLHNFPEAGTNHGVQAAAPAPARLGLDETLTAVPARRLPLDATATAAVPTRASSGSVPAFVTSRDARPSSILSEAPDERSSELRRIGEVRGIPHLIHFTRCENLSSIMRHGLLSVRDCEGRGLSSVRNDGLRLDGRPTGTSLSVAFPNDRMFYKYRMEAPACDWVVLMLRPSILWERRCTFFALNAAHHAMRGRSVADASLPEAFEAMFAEPPTRPHWLRPFDPTDRQAEVMCLEPIPADAIEAASFETAEVAECWRDHLDGRKVVHDGPRKGFFAMREWARTSSAAPALF